MSICKGYVHDEYQPTLLEGYLEIFFEHSESKQFEWLLHLASESFQTFPEIQLFCHFLPKSVIKFFLRNQLSVNQCGHQDNCSNVLQQYSCEVMSHTTNPAIMHL